MCISPIKTKNSPDPVPCGKCPECRNRHAQGWAIRLMNEYKNSTSAHFITLTYSEKHVPLTDCYWPTVVKKDLQLFLKRVRRYTGKGVKYYAAAEYGSETQRPHYHVIIFNTNEKAIEKAWSRRLRKDGSYSLRNRNRGKRRIHTKISLQTKNDNKR